MKLLLVEDEIKLLEYLRRGLSEEGFVVDVANNGIDGLQFALMTDYEIIVLDSNLPGLTGIEMLMRLRQSKQTPVLMLTARISVADRVMGLECGADDYLSKPFAFSELVARIKVLLRRVHIARPLENQTVLVLDDLIVNLISRRATRSGVRLDLTVKEFNLLSLLMRRKGEVLSRSTLAEQVWDMSFDRDTSVVDVTVCRLRAKLDEPFLNPILHTIRGVGYVLESRPA